MREPVLVPRFLALFLALCLALPGPALGLRNLEPVESGLEEQITLRLGLPAAGPEGQASDPSEVLLPRHEGELKALQWMKRMTQQKRPYLFVVGDVDWLGLLNKVYSKKLVNPVLTLIFRILQEEVQKAGGLIYRHGGDEFVILLPLARPRKGDADAKRAVQEGKEKVRRIREAVAQQILHRYVVVQSRASRAAVPKGFRSQVRARSRYARMTYYLLEVPQGRGGGRLNPYPYARRIQRAARAQGLSELRPVEIFGNESQFGFVNPHGKQFPVTVSLGGEVVLPSRGRVRKEEVSHENLLKLHRRLLLDAEDWQKQAKVLFPWKNVEAVGVSLGAKRHAHNEGRLLNRPPAVGNEPLLLQYYAPEKVRQEVMRDLASSPGRSGILLQLVPRYQWNGPLKPKYGDGPFARFKAINEFLGYGAGDDVIKLLLKEAVKEFRAFPGFRVTLARAPPTESPDMAQIWISWTGNQQPPGPSEREQWRREKAAVAAKVGRVRDGMNRALKEEIIPALADLGLQVTLDWAGAVADVDRDPEAEKVFERLQSAIMVMTDQRHLAPEEPMHGFLYHPLVVNPSVIESSRGRVERTHRWAALAEAKEIVVPRRGRAAAGLEEEMGQFAAGKELVRKLSSEIGRMKDPETGWFRWGGRLVRGLDVVLVWPGPEAPSTAYLHIPASMMEDSVKEFLESNLRGIGVLLGRWNVFLHRERQEGVQGSPLIGFVLLEAPSEATELPQALTYFLWDAVTEAVQQGTLESMEVSLENESPALSRRTIFSIPLKPIEDVQPALWTAMLVRELRNVGIEISGDWFVRPSISFPVSEPKLVVRVQLTPTSRPKRAGLEEQWQDQMWRVLAEGFEIPIEELRNRLQPTDLLDFRRSLGPESLGPKLDLYARILLGTDLPVERRQRMVERFSPLIEPPTVYPSTVVKSYEALSRAKTMDEFDICLERFVSAIQAELPGLSRENHARSVLEKFVKEEDFTPEQKEILLTVARRLVKAFHPEFENDRVETYIRFLLSTTRPVTLQGMRRTLPARIFQLREKNQAREDWASRSIDDLLPMGEFSPRTLQVLLPLVEPQDDIALAGVAAHEYGHILLFEWEQSHGKGRTHWHQEHEQGESSAHADWITEGLAVVMNRWLSRDRSEAIPMPKTVVIWFDERARQLVGESAEVWAREWGLLENLSPPIRRYVQGVVTGAIAEAVGRKVAARQPEGNPHQAAVEFLAWYAKQPQEQSVPRVEEMARAVQTFLADHGTPAAGLEEGMVFNGLTAVGPEGMVRVATDLLPDPVVLLGLEEGKTRLVVPVEDQRFAGRVFLGPGIRLHPVVRQGIGEQRIFALPADPAEARAGLEQMEAGIRDLVLLDVPHGSEGNWVSGSQGVPIINLPSVLAAQLSFPQLAGLEEAARRQPGGILRIKDLIRKDWKEPLDVFDLAA